MTITGTNFFAGSTVRFGTKSATSVVVVNTTTITCVSPSGTAGATVQVKVTNTFGSSANVAADNFTYFDGPTVTINQAAAQADPTGTSPINFTVVFSESVADFATGDVTLSGTAVATTATVTGSGTTYNVAVSGMTTNGTVIASIAAGVAHNGAAQPNAAATWTDHTVTYNNVGPTVTINQAVGQADPTNGATINFTVVFSESVADFATGDVTLTAGTAPGTLVGTVTGSGTTYNVAVTGMTGDGTVIATIAAGVAHNGTAQANVASSSSDNTVTRDTTGPTVTINQAVGQLDPTSTSPINFTVVFSESVADFAAADVTLSGTANATTAIVTGSGTTYNVAVSGMDMDGTVIATIPAGVAHDAAGNPNAGSTFDDHDVTWVDPAPTVTVNQEVGQLDPTSDPDILFTVVFSESVTGLVAGDFNVGGGASSAVTNVAGSGATYTITVTATSVGSVTLDLPAGSALDAGGKGNTVSTSSDNSVNFVLDTTDPVTASVTTPISTVYNSVSMPTTFEGLVADNAGGSGLFANSTTFTLSRDSDGHYWNGTTWQVGVFYLSTTHIATTGGTSVTWTDNVALPTWGEDETYNLQAQATDREGNTFAGSGAMMVTFTYNNVP